MVFIVFGGVYLVKKYYLTTKFGCILAIALSCFFLVTSIVLIRFSSQVGIFPIIISLLFDIFAIFGSFLCFWNNIKIDYTQNLLVITTLTRKTMQLNLLENITVSTENSLNSKKYCKIIFKDKIGNVIKINGFLSVFKHKDVEKSQKLVNQIILDINKYKKEAF